MLQVPGIGPTAWAIDLTKYPIWNTLKKKSRITLQFPLRSLSSFGTEYPYPRLTAKHRPDLLKANLPDLKKIGTILHSRKGKKGRTPTCPLFASVWDSDPPNNDLVHNTWTIENNWAFPVTTEEERERKEKFLGQADSFSMDLNLQKIADPSNLVILFQHQQIQDFMDGKITKVPIYSSESLAMAILAANGMGERAQILIRSTSNDQDFAKYLKLKTVVRFTGAINQTHLFGSRAGLPRMMNKLVREEALRIILQHGSSFTVEELEANPQLLKSFTTNDGRYGERLLRLVLRIKKYPSKYGLPGSEVTELENKIIFGPCCVAINWSLVSDYDPSDGIN